MSSVGERRHHIDLLEPVDAVDAWQQPVKTWKRYASARASRTHLTGREYWQAQQAQSEATERFNMRYIAGVTARMRVVCQGVTYEIIDPSDFTGQKKDLNLLCKAVI